MTYSDELYHHGILGQKWGIRRFRNKDGSLTNAGKKRYGSGFGKRPHWENDTPSFKVVKKPKNKARRQMTDEEKERLKKVLVTTGVVAVGALALYGAYQLSGKYYCDSLMEDNPELFNRIRGDVVKNPNKLFDQNTWSSFSKEEIDAVKGYTGNDYWGINYSLRKGEIGSLDGKMGKQIDAITSAIDKSPLKEEIVTFRGVKFDSANNFMFPNVDLKDGKAAKEQLVGAVFQEDGFFSSSPRFQSQFAGGNGVKLTTICPPGTKALYIGKESEFPYEKELLLQRGTQFEVKDVVVNSYGVVTEIIMQAVGSDLAK